MNATETFQGHDNHCTEMARVVVREEMDAELTANAWDCVAMNRENDLIIRIANEWLTNGIKDCECRP